MQPYRFTPITRRSTVADPVFDPLLAGVATVDPVRALTEVQGVFGSGTNLASAYSGELSLISKVLYPPGTQPSIRESPTNNAPPGSVDPTTLPITLTISAPLPPPLPPYYTGNVIDMGGLNSTVISRRPVCHAIRGWLSDQRSGLGPVNVGYAFPTDPVGTLQINIAMRQPYLARVQSSSAASHILRSMLQATGGVPLDGAFGTPNHRSL